jgi:hypothetical protein
VRLDGALTHVERAGDLAVAHSVCDQLGDTILGGGEPFADGRSAQSDPAELVAGSGHPHGRIQRLERGQRLFK